MGKKLLFSTLLRCNWNMTLCKFKVFNVLIWYIYILQMITTATLAKISIISHNYHFFFVWEHLRCTLSNFQVYNTVLLIMLCVKIPRIYSSSNWNFNQHLPISLTPNPQPLVTTILQETLEKQKRNSQSELNGVMKRILIAVDLKPESAYWLPHTCNLFKKAWR